VSLIQTIHTHHQIITTSASMALSLSHGTNQNCESKYQLITNHYQQSPHELDGW